MQWLFWVIYQNKKRVCDYLVHTFCMIFHKNVPYSIQLMAKVSILYLFFFSFSRYLAKCVMKFLFRQLITLQTLRFIVDQALKQWLTGRKNGEEGNTKS